MDPYLYLFDGAKIMLLIELSKSISNYLHTQGFAGAPENAEICGCAESQ